MEPVTPSIKLVESESHVGSASGDEIELGALYRAVIRRRYWAFGTFLAVVGLAIVYLLVAPRIYQSKALILIELTPPRVLSEVREVSELSPMGFWGQKAYYETQFRIIESRAVAERAAAKLGLNVETLNHELQAEKNRGARTDDGLRYSPDFEKKLVMLGLSGRTPEQIEKNLESIDIPMVVASGVQVLPIEDSNLVYVAYKSRDPEVAALLANTIADAYIEHNLAQKHVTTQSAVDWLSDQDLEWKQKLEETERGLYEFKKTNGIVSISIEERQNITAQRLTKLNEHLVDVRSRRVEAEGRLATQKQKDPAKILEAASRDIIDNTLLQVLRQDYSVLKRDEAALRERYTPDHPKVASIARQRKLVEDELREEVNRILTATKNEYDALVYTEKELLRAIDESTQDALDLSLKEIEFNKLMRERNEVAEIYRQVLSRRKETDLTRGLNVNNVSMQEAALPDYAPVTPKVKFALAIAVVVGLFFGIMVALFVHVLDNTVKSQTEVESIVGVPFLGVLPHVDDAARAEALPDFQTLQRPRSTMAECLRAVRANLMFVDAGRHWEAVLVTSSSPSEGKSTAAINLASSIAQSGERTLLVDTDLRRPRLHKAFQRDSSKGMTTILAGLCSLDEAIQKTELATLDILPAGPIPPNPGELLHSKAFLDTLHELQSRYDRVVFDSPPINAVADAVVLSKLCDGVVLVIKANHTKRGALKQAVARLKNVDAPILGAVLNDLTLGKGSYDGYHYQYSGYYYTEQEESLNNAAS